MGSTAVVITEQHATDKRQTVATGAVGISSEQSTVNVTQTDLGAVKRALDFAESADARMGASYTALLKAAGGIVSAGAGQAGSVADALGKLGSSQSGASDLQRLMIVGLIGIAVIVAAGFFFKGH